MKSLLLFVSLLAWLSSCSNNTGTLYNQERTNDEENSDRQITKRVKNALANDDSLSENGRSIYVDTTQGVVTLSGIVNSREESRYIERKVKSINGVHGVNNQLTINS